VRASDKLLSADARNASALFLTREELGRLSPPEALPDDILRVRTRLFTAFKTGQ